VNFSAHTARKVKEIYACVDAEYCDFVVWNSNDIFIERILPDMDFWDDVIPKS